MSISPLRTRPLPTGELLEQYAAYLDRSPLAIRSRSAYLDRVRALVAWLAEHDEHADALSDPVAREHALRDYLRRLRVELHRKPTTVNGHLAAANNFFLWLGLGPSQVKAAALQRSAPRALDEAGVRRLLRAAERRGSARDTAIITVLLATGIRLAELAALDLEDVALSARKGLLTVRDGKGGKYRTIPLNSQARESLHGWLQRRLATVTTSAVFTTASGDRVSTRTVDAVVRRLGAAAGLEVSAHVLRHTAATRLVRDGVDIVIVADLLGHSSLETTRRYALPSEADRAAAVERLVLAT